MVRAIAIGLIVLGVVGLVWGGFGYTRTKSEAELGPINIQVKDTKYVAIPVWVGVGAIAVGGLLLVFGGPGRKTPI